MNKLHYYTSDVAMIGLHVVIRYDEKALHFTCNISTQIYIKYSYSRSAAAG